MKTIALLAALALASCAPKAFPVGTPNPLDTPGGSAPTAAELHAKNLRWIIRSTQ